MLSVQWQGFMGSPVIYWSEPEPAAADALLDRAGPDSHRRLAAQSRERELVLTAHALARVAAAGWLGCSVGSIRLTHACPWCGSDRHGRPGAAGPGGLACSLSIGYAPDLVLVAVGGAEPVGADIEAVRDRSRWGRAASLLYSPEEADLLDGEPAGAVAALGTAFWARKEAVLKLAGVGRTVPLTGVDVARAGGTGGGPAGGRYPAWVSDVPVAAGYAAAVATPRRHLPPAVHRVTPAELVARFHC